MKLYNREERTRIKHTVSRLRAMLDSLEIALTMPGPIGEAGNAIAQTGTEIAVEVARADAYERVEHDVTEACQCESIANELAFPEGYLR